MSTHSSLSSNRSFKLKTDWFWVKGASNHLTHVLTLQQWPQEISPLFCSLRRWSTSKFPRRRSSHLEWSVGSLWWHRAEAESPPEPGYSFFQCLGHQDERNCATTWSPKSCPDQDRDGTSGLFLLQPQTVAILHHKWKEFLSHYPRPVPIFFDTVDHSEGDS